MRILPAVPSAEEIISALPRMTPVTSSGSPGDMPIPTWPLQFDAAPVTVPVSVGEADITTLPVPVVAVAVATFNVLPTHTSVEASEGSEAAAFQFVPSHVYNVPPVPIMVLPDTPYGLAQAAKTGWLANKPRARAIDRSPWMKKRRAMLLRLAPAKSEAECA